MRKNEYVANIDGFSDIYLGGQLSRYKVSNKGIVISKFKEKGWKIFHPSLNAHGYYLAVLRVGEKKYNKTIHQLVALSFISNLFNRKQINHKDGCKTNNNVENLEWCTPQENSVHSYAIGLSNIYNRKKGSVPQKVGKYFANTLLKEYPSVSKAKDDGYPMTSVHRAVKYNRNYRGFFWKYL